MTSVKEGNSAAFDELYKRYSKHLLLYFCRMLNDPEKAQDFLQDTFLIVINKADTFRNSRGFSPWLYKIAYNRCKNEYRRRDIVRRSKWVVNPQTNPDNSDFIRFLFAALENLDVKRRNIFLLRFQENLPIKQIAAVMECAEGTVKSRLFYTIKWLSARLAHFNPNIEVKGEKV